MNLKDIYNEKEIKGKIVALDGAAEYTYIARIEKIYLEHKVATLTNIEKQKHEKEWKFCEADNYIAHINSRWRLPTQEEIDTLERFEIKAGLLFNLHYEIF